MRRLMPLSMRRPLPSHLSRRTPPLSRVRISLVHSCTVTDVYAAAASSYVQLVRKEADNNAKLIVLDRLETLRSKHGHVLDPLVMDILQILSR